MAGDALPAPETPILVGLDPRDAERRAEQAGLRVAEIVRTAPPRFHLAGPLRVIGQRALGPGRLRLVVANSVALTCDCGAEAPTQP